MGMVLESGRMAGGNFQRLLAVRNQYDPTFSVGKNRLDDPLTWAAPVVHYFGSWRNTEGGEEWG